MFPVNNPATATPVPTLPLIITDNFGGIDGGQTWFAHTAGPTENAFGIHISSALGGDNPTVSLSLASDPFTPLNGGLEASPIHPAQWPTTPGTAYLVLLTAESGSANLTLDVEGPPTGDAPSGSVFITAEFPTFPFAVLFSPTTGEILRIMSLPASENADTLPSGIFCTEEETAGHARLTVGVYTGQFVRIGGITNPASPQQICVSSDQVDSFFLCPRTGAGTKVVSKLSDAAVLSGTTWTLNSGASTAVQAIGVDHGGHKLYYTSGNSGAAIQAFDLDGNADLPDFAAGITGQRPFDILCLDDGTLIVTYADAGTSALFVRHYAANGSTIADYTELVNPATYSLDHIGRDVTDSTFTIRLTGATGSIYQKIDVSLMALLSTSPQVDVFDDGLGPTGSAQFFGPAFSCPMLVTKADIPAVNPPPPPPPPIAVNGLGIDCETSLVTITGQGFTAGAAIDLRDPNGQPVQYTIVSFSSTQIVLQIQNAGSGTYCVTVTNPS